MDKNNISAKYKHKDKSGNVALVTSILSFIFTFFISYSGSIVIELIFCTVVSVIMYPFAYVLYAIMHYNHII